MNEEENQTDKKRVKKENIIIQTYFWRKLLHRMQSGIKFVCIDDILWGTFKYLKQCNKKMFAHFLCHSEWAIDKHVYKGASLLKRMSSESEVDLFGFTIARLISSKKYIFYIISDAKTEISLWTYRRWSRLLVFYGSGSDL